jgi:serine/threonine protein kinase/WD40 repeat protein
LQLVQGEYLARLANGDQPSPGEYRERFPVLIREEQEVRGLLSTASREASTAALQVGPGPAVRREHRLPEKFGRYRILRQLGAGGMGVVYLAHDTELDRLVALKVPHSAGDGPEALERFHREARAAATLTHPNLCPVYDAGVIEGVPYLTMAYVEGRTLAEFLRSGPAPALAWSAALVRKIALAMAHAHDRGVIHRDLKPANVMLDRYGEPTVMDFGLARRSTPHDPHLTQYGAVLGTPAFMSPEQVRGDVQTLGPATDVYSLGVVLYELLTGQLPFQGPFGQVLVQIQNSPPRRPSELHPGVGRPLEEVCLKALAKRPEDRFPSMTALAEALAPGIEDRGSRIEDQKPRDSRFSILDLRFLRPGRKTVRWALLVGGVAAAVLLSVLLLGPKEDPAARLGGGPTTSSEVIKADPPQEDKGVKTDVVIIPLDPPVDEEEPATLVLKESRQFKGHTGAISCVALLQDGKVAVSVSDADKSRRSWKTTTGKELANNRYQFVADVTIRSGFSADGRRLMFLFPPGMRVWDVASGREVRSLELPGSPGNYALSANGRWAAVPLYDFTTSLPYALAINVETGKVFRFRGHKKNDDAKPEAVAVSSNGKSAASAGADGLYVWEVSDTAPRRVRIPRDAVISLAFSPDAKLLLAGERADALFLWDARTGKKKHRLSGHTGPVNCVVFSPDGKWAASGGADRTARVWDVETGRELARLEGHTGEVTCLAFAADGRQLLTGSTDQTVRLWDLKALHQCPDLEDPPVDSE